MDNCCSLSGTTYLENTNNCFQAEKFPLPWLVKIAQNLICNFYFQHPKNWGLYNLASVYWRAIGNGYQSVECLRRGIHFAPQSSRDIGLIGLANVLHRHGKLESAMIAARAALDIQTDSVSLTLWVWFV